MPSSFAPGEAEPVRLKGREARDSAGDSFFAPKGAHTTWIIYDTVSKFWMITER